MKFRGSYSPKLLVSALLALSLSGCASNPTGGADVVFMSEKREIELGREMHEDILTENPIYTDPKIQDYVNKIGQRLVEGSHRNDINYTFTVIDSPDINAFATPGGYVYINRGLMTYMTNEAQLAAVLGHEIAHITARHAVQQDAAAKSSNIVSAVVGITTAITTGVNLGDISNLLGGVLISGYGRDMELEADSLGAEYLINAGYDPSAMVDVITILKNQEDFNKKNGLQGSSYHGLFSTHPRNDVRLTQAINNAGVLTDDERKDIDPQEFRNAMEGLPIGQATNTVGGQDRNRYYQTLLNYTMIFGDEWEWTETPTTLTAASPDGIASVNVQARQRTAPTDARTYINETMGISGLLQQEELSQFGLQGYTGINPDTGERLAVINYGPRAFILTGRVSDALAEANATEETDAETLKESAEKSIMEAIRTFRPIARSEISSASPYAIRYVQVGAGTTYAQLARGSVLGQYAEDRLRLINGDYPGGEPEAEEWIKIVE